MRLEQVASPAVSRLIGGKPKARFRVEYLHTFPSDIESQDVISRPEKIVSKSVQISILAGDHILHTTSLRSPLM